ncbi:hypothetical protein DNTS_008234 [Danionella cerebrum]|uniref:Uncharacterized protein n=1 Tax=Danionella cerebrum TaxID=2873325 RepID=A0A553NGM4_9TELE|nr:hypothetical protein DNTS_008234 [Danionella translucida]
MKGTLNTQKYNKIKHLDQHTRALRSFRENQETKHHKPPNSNPELQSCVILHSFPKRPNLNSSKHYIEPKSPRTSAVRPEDSSQEQSDRSIDALSSSTVVAPDHASTSGKLPGSCLGVIFRELSSSGRNSESFEEEEEEFTSENAAGRILMRRTFTEELKLQKVLVVILNGRYVSPVHLAGVYGINKASDLHPPLTSIQLQAQSLADMGSAQGLCLFSTWAMSQMKPRGQAEETPPIPLASEIQRHSGVLSELSQTLASRGFTRATPEQRWFLLSAV